MSTRIVPMDLATEMQANVVYWLMSMFREDLMPRIEHPQDIDLEHAIHTAQKIAEDGRLLLAVAYVDAHPVGLIAAAYGPGFLTSKIVAEELAFYVLPNRRKSGAGLALLRWLVREARAAGVSELFLGNKNPDEACVVDTVYRRMGFHEQHTVYRKDL